MKKIFMLMILGTGIITAQHARAQSNPSQVFDIPFENFTREFTVALDRKNSMQVSVTSMQVMDYISNMDSILKLFFNELMTIRDSLPLSTESLRLDYNMDQATVKKLRVRKNIPQDHYYAFINGAPSVLKIEQDTVIIYGKIPAAWLRRSKKFKAADYGKYYFSVAFYVNDLEDLADYKDGRLNDEIRIIQQHYKNNWQYLNDERLQLKGYPEITSATAKGYIFRSGSFTIKKSIEVQNYKDHFVPSVSCTPAVIKEGDFRKKEIGVSIEAAFSFENTVGATTKTHINVFAGLAYHVMPLTKTGYWAKIYPDVSIAWLVSRSGMQYDKNSFRVGLGSFSLGNLTTSIQPVFYFNNLFKNITPSLRIIQRF